MSYLPQNYRKHFTNLDIELILLPSLGGIKLNKNVANLSMSERFTQHFYLSSMTFSMIKTFSCFFFFYGSQIYGNFYINRHFETDGNPSFDRILGALLNSVQ